MFYIAGLPQFAVLAVLLGEVVELVKERHLLLPGGERWLVKVSVERRLHQCQCNQTSGTEQEIYIDLEQNNSLTKEVMQGECT